jgi:ArsR family transcriptional regulator
MDNSEFRCDCNIIHEETVALVKLRQGPEAQLFELADFFKVLGDPTRIRILNALAEAELCVCDIANVLNMTQSSISHQLRVLKQARLVRNRKDGKVVFYRLDDEHVASIVALGLLHLGHE